MYFLRTMMPSRVLVLRVGPYPELGRAPLPPAALLRDELFALVGLRCQKPRSPQTPVTAQTTRDPKATTEASNSQDPPRVGLTAQALVSRACLCVCECTTDQGCR